MAEFFSFGTNDLTQMTFGFSRDDVEGRMMSAYLDQGLLKRNPFETIDIDGVGELVRIATERGRATRPGAQGRGLRRARRRPGVDRVLREVGLDYVSCSPFRVPIARLAAAQAVLASGRAVAQEGGRREGRCGEEAGREALRRRQSPAGAASWTCWPRARSAPPSTFMAVAIPEEDVARVRAATDIVALIGEHVGLEALRAGASSGYARSTRRRRPLSA